MRVLLIDHETHRKTKSSNFFMDILLQSGFDVDIEYFDPSDVDEAQVTKFDARIPWRAYELVIVWQLEVLGLLAMSRGTPTVIIPMYDGCANMPASSWEMYSSASALHFSYTLHVRTKDAIPHQRYVQYYPDPAKYKLASHEGGARVFFWMRRPEDLSIDAVFRLVRAGFERLHVHLSPDNTEAPAKLPDWAKCYPITTSTWFESRRDFDEQVDTCNVMVCPRMSEGIGMVMVEALARGMCVIAHRDAIHTEYICDGVNGFLFDRDSSIALDLRRAADLGRMARKGAEEGWRRWRRDSARLPEFLKDAAAREPRVAFSPESARLIVLQYFTNMEECLTHMQHLCEREQKLQSQRTDQHEGRGALDLVPQVLLRRVADEQVALDSVRSSMNKVPGWKAVKNLVPLSLKRRIAEAMANNLRGS